MFLFNISGCFAYLLINTGCSHSVSLHLNQCGERLQGLVDLSVLTPVALSDHSFLYFLTFSLHKTLLVKKHFLLFLKPLVYSHTSSCLEIHKKSSCIEKMYGAYLLTVSIVISSQYNETILYQRKENNSVDN